MAAEIACTATAAAGDVMASMRPRRMAAEIILAADVHVVQPDALQ